MRFITHIGISKSKKESQVVVSHTEALCLTPVRADVQKHKEEEREIYLHTVRNIAL